MRLKPLRYVCLHGGCDQSLLLYNILASLQYTCAPQSSTGSESESGSQSQTPSRSRSSTPSSSETMSQSATPSVTMSRSRTQSPSPTGYPLRNIFDNTFDVSTSISDLAPFDKLNETVFRGVSWRFIENDETCGPGIYNHFSATLALSTVECSSETLCCGHVQGGAILTVLLLEVSRCNLNVSLNCTNNSNLKMNCRMRMAHCKQATLLFCTVLLYL